jgi:hypothetical protein
MDGFNQEWSLNILDTCREIEERKYLLLTVTLWFLYLMGNITFEDF